ncbi:MAG: energy-coupling factor transporter transmembrane component T family protein [Bacillota bacterium]
MFHTKNETLDPRSKLVLVLCASTLAVAVDRSIVLAPLASICFLSSFAFGADVIGALARMRKLVVVFVAMGVIQSIFTPGGDAIWQFGGISLLSTVGLERGISIVLRMLIIVISATIMTSSNPRDIIQGLYQWRIPYEITFMVAVAIRFLPLLTEEATDTLVALQLRGLRLEKMSTMDKLRIYRHLLTPLIAGVLSRARRISISVEMRGFRAYPTRTSHRSLIMSKWDYALIFSAVVASAVTAYWYFGIFLN